AAIHLLSAGSFRTRVTAAKRRCRTGSSAKFWIRPADAAERSRKRTMSTAWPKRTRRSLIIDFSCGLGVLVFGLWFCQDQRPKTKGRRPGILGSQIALWQTLA